MADFYPVLKRAVAALPAGSPAARQTVYNRARAALDRQLAGYQPPLPASETEAQRAALDRAISQVEAELGPDDAGSSGLLPMPDKPYVQHKPYVQPAGERVSLPAPPEMRALPPVPERAALAPPPVASGALFPAPAAEQAGAVKEMALPAAPPMTELPAPRSLSDFVHVSPAPDMRSVARQEDIAGGDASAGAPAPKETLSGFWPKRKETLPPAKNNVPPAKEAAAPVSAGRASDGSRINFAAVAERPAANFAAAALQADEPAGEDTADLPAGGQGDGRILLHDEPGRLHKVVAAIKNPLNFSIAVLVLLMIVLGTAGWVQRDQLAQWFHPAAFGTAGVSVTDATNDGLGPKFEDRLPPDDSLTAPPTDVRSVATQKVTPGADGAPVANTAVAAAATVTYSGDSTASSYTARGEAGASPATPPPSTATDGAARPATAAAALAAIDTATAQAGTSVQQAVFFEEPLPGVQPQPVHGTAKWSLVNEPDLPGDPPVPQVRVDVSFPERDLKMTMYIRANRDESVPISHFVDMQFSAGPAFPERGVQMVQRMIMKPSEQARGEALGGVVTQVVDNRFWLALSADRDTRARNVELLKTQGWINLQLLFSDRRRGLIEIEKGDAGTAAVNNGFVSFGG